MSQEKKEQPIGLTLSGGGFRATIFSFGVLYYLIERGLGKRIQYVASVSGGSVANGFVAQECDLSSVTPEEFRELVRRMGRKVAHEGIFRSPPVLAWLFTTMLILLAGAGATLLACTAVMRAVAMATMVLLVASALHVRGVALSWALGWQFFRRDGRYTKLQDLSERGVRHVIIATELSLGQPVFIESGWIHGPGMGHGYGKPGHILLHRAVRWSCTVPLLLPPGLVQTKAFSPENAILGQKLDLPMSLSLVDGGVCNNLGTDYHEIKSAGSFGTRPEGFYKAPKADLKISVDCSGALGQTRLKLIHVPLLSELLALPRNISILYQNTILPRLDWGAPTISIRFSPEMQSAWARKLKIGTEQADVFRRSGELFKYFQVHFETHHEEKEIFDDLGKSSSRVPTTFGALGEEATARLLWHGYLSALAISYSAFGIEPPDNICERTIYYFRRLVSNNPDSVADPWARIHHRCEPIRAVREDR
jgi:predicted acylesterase/phospholipase RssA